MPDRTIADITAASVARSRARAKLVLAAPRGFCAGVRRAIESVEHALERFGPPVYVRRAIVHNFAVIRALERKGAVFIEELEEAPRGSLVILSAHGVALSVKAEAERLGLRYLDAVCPLVAKVHREVAKHHSARRHIVLIGHAGHPEIAGILGQIPPGSATVVATVEQVAALPHTADMEMAYATQTTYSVEEAAAIITALKDRFPRINAPASSDICYATTNRQAAVKQLASRVDAIIVAGETFSSNACRLVEVARAARCPSVQLVAEPTQIDWRLLDDCRSIGITAAASTPDSTVSAIVDHLARRFDLAIEELGDPYERAVFKPLRVDEHASAP